MERLWPGTGRPVRRLPGRRRGDGRGPRDRVRRWCHGRCLVARSCGVRRNVPEAGVDVQVQQRSRLLKGAVVALSLVLAVCAIVITTAIVYRMIKPAPPAPLPPFGMSALPVPVGCTIDYVTAEGDRLIVEIGG